MAKTLKKQPILPVDQTSGEETSRKSKKRKSRDDETEDKLKKDKKPKKIKKTAKTEEGVPSEKLSPQPDTRIKIKNAKTKKPRNEIMMGKHNSQEEEDVARKERKRLRKLRKRQDALANAVPDALDESPDVKTTLTISKTKLKSDEFGRGHGKRMITPLDPNHSEKLTSAGKERKHTVAIADQWNPDALSGDAIRKNKFLRLLGAGKGSGIDTNANAGRPSGQATDKDIQRVESELERQFEAGVKMKHDGQGKRRGLGA